MDRRSQPQLAWRKSSRSTAQGDNCVEVAPLPDGGRAFRDSKDPDGPRLEFNAGEWAAFRLAMRNGEFD